jgi:hypothetical protein
MKVREVPDGFEKVLQFNVYMRGAEGREPQSDVRYTVTDSYAPRNASRDYQDRHSRDERGSGGYRGRPIGEISPEDVGDIRSFLHRVKSETGDDETRRTYEHRPRDETMEDTMFKPRRKDGPAQLGEMTEEKTPERANYGKKDQESPEGVHYYQRHADPNESYRPEAGLAEERRQSYSKDDRLRAEDWEDDTRGREDPRYLEIFVRPKRGNEKLVYRENGEPAEIVHRFTPKKDYDRYNQEPEDRRSKLTEEDDSKYRQEYRKPELYVPTSSHKKYVPRNEEDYSRPSPKTDQKRPSTYSDHSKSQYKPRNDDIHISEYDLQRPKASSNHTNSNHPIPPEEAYARYSRVEEGKPKDLASDKGRPYTPGQTDKPKSIYKPDGRFDDRPSRESRGRYPDDLMDYRKPSYKPESMDDEERKRYQERQRELIDALYHEKNALKELVDRLCNRLDHDEPSGRNLDENEQGPRPREEYVNVPSRKSTSPAPKADWHPGPYKNSKDRADILSKSERKSPFDVDKRYGKTEWEISEPYLKQYEKFGKSPQRRVEQSPREGSRSPVPNRYERTAPPRVNTYSPVRDSPKAGDNFCGLCDVYLDKEKYRRDTEKSRNPSVERFNDEANHYGKTFLL